jgi:hypothetical protein
LFAQPSAIRDAFATMIENGETEKIQTWLSLGLVDVNACLPRGDEPPSLPNTAGRRLSIFSCEPTREWMKRTTKATRLVKLPPGMAIPTRWRRCSRENRTLSKCINRIGSDQPSQ